MSAPTKISISETLGSSFSFSWSNYIPLTVVYLALSLVILGPIFYLTFKMFPGFFADPMAALDELSNTDPMGLEETVAFQKINALSNLLQIGTWIVSAVFAVVIINALTLGKSIWRPALEMNVLRYFVGVIVVVLIAILALLLALVIGVVIGGIGANLTDNDGIKGLAIFMAIICAAVPFIYVMIRASLIPIDMVVASKIRVAEGWAISQGQVGRLFLTYLSAWFLSLFIIIFALGLSAALLFAGGAAEIFALMADEASDVEAPVILGEVKALFTSPLGIAAILAYSLPALYVTYVQTVVPVAAYLNLTQLDRSQHEPHEAEVTLV